MKIPTYPVSTFLKTLIDVNVSKQTQWKIKLSHLFRKYYKNLTIKHKYNIHNIPTYCDGKRFPTKRNLVRF